ncbi:amino acid adenylation domain-containing protein [Archangium primigenium]|uniref:amino acid adenylation domain-containing protein n=1 Tax=[Archangium] primigenium TaxID=2792470 RepID=UPI001957E9E3|nr:amino acid adenylation domain-containing protein [Archangium primigenium]
MTFPLSTQQREMWLDQALHPDSPLYNAGGHLHIEGALEVELLERALEHVLQTNEALRLELVEAEPLARQYVAARCDPALARLDFSGEDGAEQRALAWMDARMAEPMPLYSRSLFRFALLKVAPERHYLLARFHHLIVDGFSIALVLQRLAQAYNTLRAGHALAPESEPSYLDIVAAQRAYESSEDHARDAAYWREYFSSIPEPLAQPVSGGALAQDAQRTVELLLSREFITRLASFARRHDVTAAHVLMGVLYGYFTRTGQRDDLALGLATRNRFGERASRTVGMCSNTIVAWYRFGTRLSFSQLLRAIREDSTRGAPHRRFPHSEINRQVKVTQTGRSQLADVFVSYVGGASDVLLGEARARFHYVVQPHESAGLTVYMEDIHAEGAVRVAFVAGPSFHAEDLTRLRQGFQCLLEDALERPEVPLRELRLMTDAERQRLLGDFNASAMPVPEQCVHQLFEAQVARTPHAPALCFEDGPHSVTLTYRELDSRANQLAHALRSRGVGPERLVAVLLERSVELIVSLLAIHKAGGAYLPLLPSTPRARLDFLLQDAQPHLLLTQSSLSAHFQLPPARCLLLDAERSALALLPSHAPACDVSPDHLAYVIYTSGSTGLPKGVLVPHRGLHNTALAQLLHLGLQPSDRVLQFASISFDAATGDVWLAFAAGATLCLGSRDALAPGEPLLDFLQRQRISALALTPSSLAALPAQALPALRTLIVGGEACPAELVRQWAPDRRFFNIYGPTEVTISSTLARCDPSPQPPAIGRPLANTRAYVLDRHLRPVPLGVAGELYLGGVGVSRGYLHRPDLTAERFIPNPFEEGRLYRTGDLARWRGDGQLDYLGRADDQVKLRGFRIELGEVEQALRELPGVREACVLLRSDARGEPGLAAYLVAHADPPPHELQSWLHGLRQALASRLPDYMLPSSWVTLEALPLTAHGKVDRSALPAPSFLSHADFVPPRTALEHTVSTLWQQVLDLPQVSVHDDFFTLGGHSLLATRVAAHMGQQLGQEVPLRLLFETRTLASFAERLQALAGDTDALDAGLQTIARAERTGPLPLSFAQQRLWFLDQLGAGSAYNMPLAQRLTGALDASALQSALAELVRRHESLRTIIQEQDGEASQHLLPASGFALSHVDVRDLPLGQREDEVLRLALEDSQRPFDLTRDYMLRALLVRVDEHAHVLLLCLHHIASDGWSMGVLQRELGALYAAFHQGHASPLPELPLQYADFAVWQREWLRGERLERQVDYWKRRLAGAPPLLQLPIDRPRPGVLTFEAGVLHFEVPPALVSAVRAVGQQAGATLFMTLLTAFQVLMSRWSGQRDVVVGSPIAGRTRAELEPLIGFFVNTLALRADLSAHPSFRELLAQVKHTTQEAFAHQELPFERLVEELAPERHQDFTPLVQVVLALQNAPQAPLHLPGLAHQPLPPRRLQVRTDLEVHLWEQAGGLSGAWVYNSALFDASTLERMKEHFLSLLDDAARRPDCPVDQLSLLSDAERRKMLVDFNASAAPVPEQCVHQLFEAQVARTPHAPALCFEDGPHSVTLTYRELDSRANQLAHALRSRGVGPERLVAVLLERSVELIVSLLAIHKAGGAYLPLLPSTPQARLDFLLQDAQPHLVLTQASLSAHFQLPPARCLLLDAERSALALLPSHAPACDVSPDHLAYVIYTSGSTGLPKGVLVPHRGLHNTALAQLLHLGLQPSDRVLQFASISFDAATGDVWLAFAAGATLCLGSRDALAPGEPLLDFLQRQRISALVLTPSSLAALPTHDLPMLRTVIVAGEACPAELVRQWAPGRRFFNIYGPTEASIDATFARCEPDMNPVPIGRPIANAQAYVLDRHLRPVPLGVAGELYLGGVGVSRGYLHRPDLTAERFIPNPFEEGRLYRTGDLARWRGDGQLDYLGRTDDQVKLRGFRIELGEVEQALRELPGVREACVLLRSDARGEPGLAAYLVAHTGPAPHESQSWLHSLRQALASRLPDYMLPSSWVTLEALPLTAHGKVDRAALPAPSFLSHADFVPPRTALEHAVARVWCDVLGVSEVGVHDDFFSLGGHSLLALRLLSQLKKVFGQPISLGGLFQNPTVAALAVLLASSEGAEPWAPLVLMQPRGSQPPFFCVPGVGGDVFSLYALARHLGPERPVYALQAVGLDSHTPPDTSLHAMAERYERELLRVRPHGPYHLGGHSLGGWVAFHLARRLRARGEKVSLSLFDAIAHRHARARAPRDQAEVMDMMLEFHGAEMDGDVSAERARLAHLDSDEERLQVLREGMERLKVIPPGMELALLRGRVRVFHAGLRMEDLPEEPLDAPVRLFAAHSEEMTRQEKEAGWSRLCTRLTVEQAAGQHTTLVKPPHAESLARQLAPWLDALDAEV